MKLLYLAFNLFTAVPIGIYLFINKRSFFSRKLLASLLLTATIFVVWDVWAAGRGHWGFNDLYVLGPRIAGIPFEEVLFFITVPFACLGIWTLLPSDKRATYDYRRAFVVLGIVCVLCGLAVLPEYTRAALLGAGLASILVAAASLALSGRYFAWLGIVFGLFFVCNWFLTGVPIITYGVDFIIGARIITIPIEDFFFNFALLNTALIVYTRA